MLHIVMASKEMKAAKAKTSCVLLSSKSISVLTAAIMPSFGLAFQCLLSVFVCLFVCYLTKCDETSDR